MVYGDGQNDVQRGTKRYVNRAKQDPGNARQSSEARARTKFSQPRTNLFVSLCNIEIKVNLTLVHDHLPNPVWTLSNESGGVEVSF